MRLKEVVHAVGIVFPKQPIGVEGIFHLGDLFGRGYYPFALYHRGYLS